MPCFKGIAVSVHAEGAPIAEYGVQKQSRMSRVATYIPVPKAKIPDGSASGKPEPAKFAISITLLTPGLDVPYSKPKPSPSNPQPCPQTVAGLPGSNRHTGGTIGPYIPITKSENETIAAYIYFDGRAKEEVATLLRPGEETWVNSRWVQVSQHEGGGLAEREFLFREVGLERWLNGLDLEGQDAAAKIEKRRQKFLKKRNRIKKENTGSDDELADMMSTPRKTPSARSVLRYGEDVTSPVEKLSGDEDEFSSDSEDDEPPEAAGQIKVAMFRVLASGEIKRGEYSPQFDANDDEDENGQSNGDKGDGDIDHTTSFAKPKTLDPKSISTQTVTGIDGPDKPFAVFTFFYRGERQMQKMGLIPTKNPSKNGTSASEKRRSTRGVDFGTLNPLKSTGTVGFSTFRDNGISKARKSSNGDLGGNAMVDVDSDEDDDDDRVAKMQEVEDKEVKDTKELLSPEDARRQGELADGVGRIKLKRAHSAEPLSAASRKSPASITEIDSPAAKSPSPTTTDGNPTTLAPSIFNIGPPDDAAAAVGSPLKKHRASLMDSEGMSKRLAGFTSMGDIVSAAEKAHPQLPEPAMKDEDEEL